jgi:mono/diheme cytochrome c family protein
MTKETEPRTMFAAAILPLLLTGLTLFVVPIAQANPGTDSATTTFRTKCAMCHGPDGSGSEVGKSLNVPDLRSPQVQKLTDAQLVQIVSDGKGAMPSFKNSFSANQIHALVSHVRTLRQKK